MPQSERVGPTCRGSALSSSSLEDIDSSCVVGAFIEATTGPNGCRAPLHTDVNATCTNSTMILESGGCLPCATSLAGIFHCTNPPVEFQVNNVTTIGSQREPSTAGLIAGGYVITWTDSSTDGISAKAYDKNNNPVTAEFQVNMLSMLNEMPRIAALTDGGYVIVWKGFDGVSLQIFARAYDASHAAVTGEFMVSNSLAISLNPSIGALIDGRYVIAWDETNSVYAREYNADHTQVTAMPFVVNTIPIAREPAVTGLMNGGYVIVWESLFAFVSGQAYNSDGTTNGMEFSIAVGGFPSIGGLLGGQYVVSWHRGGDAYAKGYNSNNIEVAPEYRVNTIASNVELKTSISGLSNGGYLNGWSQLSGGSINVFAKIYDKDFNQFGNEVQLNEYTTLSQTEISVGWLTSGGHISAWQSEGQDGSSFGIFAKAYDDAVIHQI